MFFCIQMTMMKMKVNTKEIQIASLEKAEVEGVLGVIGNSSLQISFYL